MRQESYAPWSLDIDYDAREAPCYCEEGERYVIIEWRSDKIESFDPGDNVTP